MAGSAAAQQVQPRKRLASTASSDRGEESEEERRARRMAELGKQLSLVSLGAVLATATIYVTRVVRR